MAKASRTWVEGLVLGFDPGRLPDSKFEYIGILLVFCKIGSFTSGTILITKQIRELQMAGFQPVGAVLRDGGKYRLCGRESNSSRFQVRLVLDAPRIFVEAGVALSDMRPDSTAGEI
jgi:hypothetical protein